MDNLFTAFADEFGNNSFDFKTQSSHFIIATVICKKSYLEELKVKIDEIRRKHNFQTGELKSSTVAGNFTRRINILQDIVKLNVSIYAVIVDKRKLIGDGFNFKKSFYKFLNNLLYKELFRTFPKLELYVDEHGGNEFMKEFKKYVARTQPKNLFTEFYIENSKQNYFIQIADFIAGTLGYIFDETKKTEHSQTFEEILRPISNSFNFFPRDYSFEEIQETNVDENFDPYIAEVCHLRIQNFIDKNAGENQQKTDQLNFLKLLLLYQRVNLRNRYITTSEIFSHLNSSRRSKIKPEEFRSTVVGNLRDQGVLISSSRSGYKIPTSAKDLDNFINLGKRIILPMLHRIREARNTIMLATNNELDLLSKEEFKELKKLLD